MLFCSSFISFGLCSVNKVQQRACQTRTLDTFKYPTQPWKLTGRCQNQSVCISYASKTLVGSPQVKTDNSIQHTKPCLYHPLQNKMFQIGSIMVLWRVDGNVTLKYCYFPGKIYTRMDSLCKKFFLIGRHLGSTKMALEFTCVSGKCHFAYPGSTTKFLLFVMSVPLPCPHGKVRIETSATETESNRWKLFPA